jgi:hypothetical protein
MSQPVRVSQELVLDARATGKATRRSIAGQIEFWASLGRAIEPILNGEQAIALQRSGTARPLSECLGSVDSARGRRRVRDWLGRLPFPHYELHTKKPGLLIRTEADGSQTIGRFVRRGFVAAKGGR